MAIWLLRAAEGHARLQVAFAAVSKQFAAGKVSGKKTFVQDRPLEKRLGDWNFQLTTCPGSKARDPGIEGGGTVNKPDRNRAKDSSAVINA